jgi:hypothetical protein
VGRVDTLENGLNMSKMMRVAKAEISGEDSQRMGDETFMDIYNGKTGSYIAQRRQKEEAKGKNYSWLGEDGLMDRLNE